MNESNGSNPHHSHGPEEKALKPAEGRIRRGAVLEAELDPGMKALAEALRWLFAMLKVVMVVVVGLFIWSGVYKVEQNEQAIELRFGRVKGVEQEAILQPGLHWKWPEPIEEVIRIPASTVEKQIAVDDFWYYQTEKEKAGVAQGRAGDTLQFVRDGYSLTASKGASKILRQREMVESEGKGHAEGIEVPETDYNVVHTGWSIRYRVTDPLAFVTHLWDGRESRAGEGLGWYAVEGFLKDVLSDAVIQTSANRDIGWIIWEEPTTFRMEVEERMMKKLKELEVGLTARLELVRQAPPRQVQPFFEMATSAGILRDQKEKDALAKSSEIVNAAQAEASIRIAEAEAYAKGVVQSAKADAGYMKEVLQKIEDKAKATAPGEDAESLAKRKAVSEELLAETVDQLYHEMLASVMSEAEETFVLKAGEGADVEWRPVLSRDPMIGKRKAAEAAKK